MNMMPKLKIKIMRNIGANSNHDKAKFKASSFDFADVQAGIANHQWTTVHHDFNTTSPGSCSVAKRNDLSAAAPGAVHKGEDVNCQPSLVNMVLACYGAGEAGLVSATNENMPSHKKKTAGPFKF